MPGELEQETSSAVTAMTLRSGAPPLAPPSPPPYTPSHTLSHTPSNTFSQSYTLTYSHTPSHTLTHTHTHSHTHHKVPDPTSGIFYFHNKKTGETMWSDPYKAMEVQVRGKHDKLLNTFEVRQSYNGFSHSTVQRFSQTISLRKAKQFTQHLRGTSKLY